MRPALRHLLLATLSFAACRTPDKGEPRVAEADSGRGTVSGVDDPRPAAAADADSGGLVITSRTGSVNLGLAGGRVYMQLSDSVRRQVRTQMATNPAAAPDTTTAGGALGAFIERTVKKTVQEALDQRLSRPLDEIEDIRYENGEIVFAYRGSGLVRFEQVKVNDEPVLRTFAPEDARRFVEAVRRAKGM
jgi:hypothetical protein